jgi:hypothetical protein
VPELKARVLLIVLAGGAGAETAVLRFMEAIGTEGEVMTWAIAERGWAGPDASG